MQFNVNKIQSPTQAIMITIPLWLVAYFGQLEVLGLIAAGFGTVVLSVWLWNALGNSLEMVRMLRLGAVFLCLFQNAGWLSAANIHYSSLNRSIESTLSTLMSGGMRIESYFLAIVYVSLFGAFICYLGSQEKVLKLEMWFCKALYDFQFVSTSHIVRCVAVVAGLSLLMILTGVVGQRNIVVEGYDEGKLPFWYVLFRSILPVITLLNAILLIKLLKNSNKIYWALLVFSILITTYMYFSQGRRPLVFSIIIFGFWYCFFLGIRPKLKRIIIIVVVLYPFISQLLLFSNFLRGANASAEWQTASAIDFLPAAWKSFNSSSQILEQEEETTTNNLASRPLVATPLAMCLQYPEQFASYTLGENLINSIVWVIPGPLIKNKGDYPTQETLLYKHFKIGKDDEEDTSDSLYLTAYTEFWWFGILFYGWLLYSLWKLIITLSYNSKLKGIYISISICVFQELFMASIGESSPLAWLVALRSFLFWVLVYKALLFFKIIKNKPSNTLATI
ncbi:hypothetical protein GR160_12115 [Flavobacterium sp. Sd200]|uniref:hypothetical protein n=1 Tax=Flavobacterium sp. Sd200 TaxID=2692211 RepID=UPI00136BB9F8|nr:hypothetical protein [Flavobacterium sp. Sd200]MXN91970.1 hypothetical protein [Flavobacterium sp. Sd200]